MERVIVRLVDARDTVREAPAPWKVPGLRPRWFVHDGIRFDAASVDDAGVWTFRSRATWPVGLRTPARMAVVVNEAGDVVGEVPITGTPEAVLFQDVTCPLWCVRNFAGQVEYRHG